GRPRADRGVRDHGPQGAGIARRRSPGSRRPPTGNPDVPARPGRLFLSTSVRDEGGLGSVRDRWKNMSKGVRELIRNESPDSRRARTGRATPRRSSSSSFAGRAAASRRLLALAAVWTLAASPALASTYYVDGANPQASD